MDALDAFKANRIARRTGAAPPPPYWDYQPCAWCWTMTDEDGGSEPEGDGWLCATCACAAWVLVEVERHLFDAVLQAVSQEDHAALRLVHQRFLATAQSGGVPVEGPGSGDSERLLRCVYCGAEHAYVEPVRTEPEPPALEAPYDAYETAYAEAVRDAPDFAVQLERVIAQCEQRGADAEEAEEAGWTPWTP